MSLDSRLVDRLRAIGIEPGEIHEPGETWRRLCERFGARITLIDRYALEANHRGVAPEQLDEETRRRLGAEVLLVQFPGLEYVPGAERHDDEIEVVPYDDAWPERFAAWRERLQEQLGGLVVSIQHVGSTAVTGLAAKPIVDIQVSVPDVDAEAAYRPAIERAGLRLRAREPGHRYFRPPADRPRDVHLHVCQAGSSWELGHLLFRDYLRVHPAQRDAYGALKLDLARRYANDRLAYTDAKSAFILDALDAAAEWVERTGWRVLDR